MSDEQHYGLVLAFDSDEPEFIRGFEAGRLWEQLKTAKAESEPVEQTIHATNSEMAIRMCESLELEFSAEDLDEIHVEFRAWEKT